MKKTIILLIVIIQLSGCYGQYSKCEINIPSMGTNLQIILYHTDKQSGMELLNRIPAFVSTLERRYSTSIQDSLISQLNRDKFLANPDSELLQILSTSMEICKLTNGAFDPALYNLIHLWEFNKPNYIFPSRNSIDQALQSSGYNNLIVSAESIELLNGASVHLGGIAKGLIISRIAAFLKSNGASNFIVNGGGDIVIDGLAEGRRKWNVAITNPYHPERNIGLIEMSNGVILTSGDYQRFIIKDGIRYHHIVNPVTGYPVSNNLTSVTVICDDAVRADALATAFFVMGREQSLQVAQSSGVEVIFIENNEENMLITVTDGLRYTVVNNSYSFELINDTE